MKAPEADYDRLSRSIVQALQGDLAAAVQAEVRDSTRTIAASTKATELSVKEIKTKPHHAYCILFFLSIGVTDV